MKTRFDVEDYVQKHGGAPLRNSEWVLTCPHCQKEDKLAVNVETGAWHCWVCEEYRTDFSGKRIPIKGAGGIIALVKWLEGCSTERAKALVAAGSVPDYGIDLFDLESGWEPVETACGPVEIPPPPGWKPIEGNLPYCEQRGISAGDVISFGLVYCDSGRYRNRLIFPVWEAGKLLYYQARAMWEPRPGEKHVKALNPPKVPGALGPADVLFNLETAKHYARVAITEGPIDAIHTGLDAVCSWGKKLSDIQILRLVRAGVKAVDLIWDRPSETEPKGAWPEMIKTATRLSGIFDTRLVFLPYGDPGNYQQNEITTFRQNARPASSISRLALI